MYSEASPWLSSGCFDELAKSLAYAGWGCMLRLFPCPELFTVVLCSPGVPHPELQGFFVHLSSHVYTSWHLYPVVGFNSICDK